MPRPSRTRNGGRSYEKRPVAGNRSPRSVEVEGLTSADARALAAEITAQGTRWRVLSIRLIENRACCLVIHDQSSGEEHQITSAAEWQRLSAAAPHEAQAAG